jgi:hypothetical protein
VQGLVKLQWAAPILNQKLAGAELKRSTCPQLSVFTRNYRWNRADATPRAGLQCPSARQQTPSTIVGGPIEAGSALPKNVDTLEFRPHGSTFA